MVTDKVHVIGCGLLFVSAILRSLIRGALRGLCHHHVGVTEFNSGIPASDIRVMERTGHFGLVSPLCGCDCATAICACETWPLCFTATIICPIAPITVTSPPTIIGMISTAVFVFT